MEDLTLNYETIEGELKGLPSFNAKAFQRYFKPEDGPEGLLLFKIRYEPGEIIMPKGGFSDYAAVHLSGRVHVSQIEPELPRPPACWDKPGPVWRFLLGTRMGSFLSKHWPGANRERTLATPTGPSQRVALSEQNKILSVWKNPEVRDEKLDVQRRFLGITSVLWRRPRSVTLLADNDRDQPCEMLLIKRRALMDLLFTNDPVTKTKTAPLPLYVESVKEFLKDVLPHVLSTNRLFSSLAYVEDVERWPELLEAIQRPTTAGARRIVELLDPAEYRQLNLLYAASLENDDIRYRIISALNSVLRRADLLTPIAWPAASLPRETLALSERSELTPNERSRLHRLLLEAAFPNTFRTIRDYRPSTPEQFAEFGQMLLSALGSSILPIRPREGDVIFDEGEPAEILYLILNGRFRVTGRGSGEQRIILNHLEEDGYFGEGCLDENATHRSARVEALTSGTLLPIQRAAILKVIEAYPDFGRRLQLERARRRRRDRVRSMGQRLPPNDPPPAIASRLMRATNLLVIDMNRCTRCDQCVQGCTAAHDDRPRFHRGNPELRVGKWEIAAACVHCVDAPCLEECPVGAITFLDRGEVHIHRTRCIGCEKCSLVCPFHVIDMYELTSPEDGQSLPRDKEGKLKTANVATKCDLCLTEDRSPPCVVACPYGAAERGQPEDFFPGMRGWTQFTDSE